MFKVKKSFKSPNKSQPGAEGEEHAEEAKQKKALKEKAQQIQ